jgi:cell division protein ZapA (FtsZ GTPase activity inhibitor)
LTTYVMKSEIVDLSLKEAFDLLYKEAWRPEEAAMGNSTLPTVLDKLCMVANINTRTELKKAEIKLKESKIQALQEKIDSLEKKINDQAIRLDALNSSINN